MRDEATRTRGSLEEALAVERSLPEARARIESLRSQPRAGVGEHRVD